MTAKKYFTSWAAAAIWLTILAYLTLQAGDDTSALSLGITRWLTAILKQIIRYEVSTFTLNMVLRKTAHVVAFFVLGLLLTNVIRMTFIKLKREPVCAVSGIVCAIIAVSCEFSKTFIPGRHCQWDEAAIDIAAAFTGVLCHLFLVNLRRRKKSTDFLAE